MRERIEEMAEDETNGRTRGRRSIASVWDVGESLTPGMRSAARPFRVLEFFDEVRRPARAREIARYLAMPQSTSSVLLKAMVGIGYLDYEPDTRCYRPSLRVTLLGSWRDSGHLRAGALMTMIAGLAERTGLSASLSNRSGIFLRYVQTAQREDPSVPHIKLAARRYAVWSTGGLVLVADLTDREIKQLLRRTRAEHEPRAQDVDADRMWAMIDGVRQTGWSCETGLSTAGICAIARAVPAAATGYGEPLALTLSNGTADLGQPAEHIAAIMASAIAGLGDQGHDQNFTLSCAPAVRGAPT